MRPHWLPYFPPALEQDDLQAGRVRGADNGVARYVHIEVKPRRPGDVAELVADASKAQQRWGWEPRFNLADMCRDAWNFQLANPGGYEQSF